MFRTLVYLFYWTVQAIGFPLLWLYLGWRITRNPQYRQRLGERFGFWFLPAKPHSADRVWLHAVSVGEILTAVPLLRRLREELPSANVYVSTTTLAGRELAEARMTGLADGVFYAPVDYRFAVRAVLRRIRPSLVVVLETEIWPNLFRETRRSGARLLMVNARISDQAFPRYLRWRWFFRPVLSYPDRILAQGTASRDRYHQLGAVAEDGGNLKYDIGPPADPVASQLAGFLDRLAPRKVWIAASTMPPAVDGDPDEDDVFVRLWLDLAGRHPDALAVLAPRRPERFARAATVLTEAGIPFVRRSALEPETSLRLPGVLLLDTIGELAGLFSRAQVVWMGGSLAHRGGHNPLEPALFSVPVVAGPHMSNFPEITADLDRAGGIVRVASAADLAAAVDGLLLDETRAHAIGRRAEEVAATRRGATAPAMAAIVELLPNGLSRPLPSLPRRLALTPLSWLWQAGMAADRSLRPRRTLSAPILSVGNLAMGGTGKTPFVVWLGGKLRELGHRPAILTRGYRRQSGQSLTVVLPGQDAPLALTGEEAQFYIRAGFPTAIGADRHAAGTALHASYGPDLFLLDDGFQHWTLRNKTEIVLVDATDPFRGGVLPLGRLREPFTALHRADAVVITRVLPGRRYPALEALIHRHNHAVPIFYASLEAQPPALPEGAAGAFCGLGQPESFAATLAGLGIRPTFFEAFSDHHRYTAADLAPMAARCDFLLTTEKDLFNIEPALASRFKVSPVAVRMVLLDEPAFMAWLTARF